MTRTTAFTAALVGFALSATTAMAVPTEVMFGSDNDGYGGFTTNQLSPGFPFPDEDQESWELLGDRIRYINDDPDGTVDSGTDGGTRNGSLLAPFTLDRTVGNAYTVTGVVNLADGYADDNNRVGIYLFGDYPDLGRFPEVPLEFTAQDEVGALGVIFNMDDDLRDAPTGDNTDDNLTIRQGIDNNPDFSGGTLRNQESTEFAQDLFGTEITLTADITFRTAELGEALLDVNGDPVATVGGEELIDVVAHLTEADGTKTTTGLVTVLASEFTGDYFGFVTRARNRGVTSNGGRNAPWTMEYLSFSIVPAAAEMLAGDANGDGQVDGNDLISVEENFGATGDPGIPGDANGDGQVDGNDLISVEENFGSTSGAASVPEPTTMALLGLGGLALLRRRK